MVGAIQQNRQVEDTNDGTIDDPNVDRQSNSLNLLEPTAGSFEDDYQPTNESEIYYDESFSYLTRGNLSHFSRGVMSGFGPGTIFRPIWFKFWDKTPLWARSE